MASYRVMALVTLLVSASMAQQYSNDYDYQEEAAPVQPRAAAQRSYSRPAPPQQQALRPSGPAVPKPPPVAILKQINRHNDDGSYTYGYEGADGSFKIETKLATGEVMGKYGYVDDTGKTRTVEYGANKYGFQPSGEGITVAPPTLVDETLLAKGDRAVDYDDGSYYEEAAPIRQQVTKTQRPKRPKVVAQPHQQQYFENSYEQQRPQHYQPQPQYQAQPQYQPQPQPQPRPQPQPQQYQPQPQLQHFPSSPAQRAGPEPPRAQITGAIPAPISDGAYRRPQQQQHVAQQPQRVYPTQPAPVHQYQPAPAAPIQRPPQQARSGSGFFDQLTQDYALPRGGSSTPLHDITFGLNLNY